MKWKIKNGKYRILVVRSEVRVTSKETKMNKQIQNEKNKIETKKCFKKRKGRLKCIIHQSIISSSPSGLSRYSSSSRNNINSFSSFSSGSDSLGAGRE